MQYLTDHFNLFVDNISLGEPQTGRIESAANSIMEFLRSEYGLSADQVFLQGSYPNGTAVEPVEDGEYDVDIVVVCVDASSSPNQALDELEDKFRANGNYSNRIKRKKPCVRLEYAEDDVGKFHVDVVPLRPSSSAYAPQDAPRRDEGWHETAPAEYTQWCISQGDPFQRNVKMLKRWRDEQQTVRNAIKSIVLQVLAATYMPTGVSDDQERLVQTFKNMHEALKDRVDPPSVFNPVLPTEDLARNWSREAFASFIEELNEAVELSQQAANAVDRPEAIDKWRTLLGEDFPANVPETDAIVVSDYSHADSPEEMGWITGIDQRYSVTIDTQITRGRRGQLRPIAENHVIFAGNKLKFKARLVAFNHVDVWWQVANTGKHARDQQGLRGAIFRGKDLRNQPTNDQTENWEDTAYTGAHLIRALLVRNNTVVAESAWRVVKVWAPRHPFGF